MLIIRVNVVKGNIEIHKGDVNNVIVLVKIALVGRLISVLSVPI